MQLQSQIKSKVGELNVVLRYQIVNEWDFSFDGQHGIEYLDTISHCDCLFNGTKTSPVACTKGKCKAGTGIQSPYKLAGLIGLVEKMEAENWLLRVWRFRHPSVEDWRERLLGKGFKNVDSTVFEKMAPVLGQGYKGAIDKDRRVGGLRAFEAKKQKANSRSKILGIPVVLELARSYSKLG